ncbi:MAG: dynamin [Spirulina sp. SIO3F2]|nr:dynamin [Spirulina sp. SIO3F2]
MDDLDSLASLLESSCDFLNHEKDKELINDIRLVCSQLNNPYFKIAFLAPFNFGKSTLINALLGSYVLPSKVIRTTALSITVKYEKKVKAIVNLSSGATIKEDSLNILKEFATLDRRGNRKSDVESIEVSFPSILLKQNIELIDLPGTNDSESQNKLVKDIILGCDLIIQVLSANQAFTLDEQIKNQSWLIDRGIKEFIFVINKMNQVENELDRKEIFDDVVDNIESIDSIKRKYLKTLYRVDALPALKSAKAKDFSGLMKSGALRFKVDLCTLVHFFKKEKRYSKLTRFQSLARKVKSVLLKRKEEVMRMLKIEEEIREAEIQKFKQRESFFLNELQEKIKSCKSLLGKNSISSSYELELAKSLEEYNFDNWRNYSFKKKVLAYFDSLEDLINKACNEFNNNRLERIVLDFSTAPKVVYPSRQSRNAWEFLGDVFGNGSNKERLDKKYEKDKWESYKRSAREYLSQFSYNSLKSLEKYELRARVAVQYNIPPEPIAITSKKEKIKNLARFINRLDAIEHYAIRHESRLVNFGLFQKIEFLFVFLKNYFFIVCDSLI